MEDETTMTPFNFQDEFDLTIGRLDRVLSKLVGWGRLAKLRKTRKDLDTLNMDEANQQTLKHHAEDMIAAGEKILRDLGAEVEATPQPEEKLPQPTCAELAEIDDTP